MKAKDRSIETERADLVSYLGVLAARLRVEARALHGMATMEGDAGSVEAREQSEMALDIEIVADSLDLIRHQLCPACRMMEAFERVGLRAGKGQEVRVARSGTARGGPR